MQSELRKNSKRNHNNKYICIFICIFIFVYLIISIRFFLAEIAFGLVLYRILPVSALAWPFVVINRKVCPAEFNK